MLSRGESEEWQRGLRRRPQGKEACVFAFSPFAQGGGLGHLWASLSNTNVFLDGIPLSTSILVFLDLQSSQNRLVLLLWVNCPESQGQESAVFHLPLGPCPARSTCPLPLLPLPGPPGPAAELCLLWGPAPNRAPVWSDQLGGRSR